MKLKILVTAILFCTATQAFSSGDYENPSNQARLIIQGDHDETDPISNNGSSSSLVRQLGVIDRDYYADVEKTLSQNANRSYAKITSNGKDAYVYTAKRTSYSMSNTPTYSTQSTSPRKDAYDHIISQMSAKYGVSKGLIKAVIHTESAFNPQAVSHAGARGLMQLMPATAQRFNVSNSYDPHQNIEGGVKYLRWLMNRFDGNLTHVLAGYNAGEGNVDKYGGIPPFRETQGYVKKVLERYNALYNHF